MKDTEKLVVLIPHYNQKRQLEQTLRSITFAEPLSVIIVDDGSTDNHKLNSHWISSLNTTFPIKVITLEKNSGITTALNTGLRAIFESRACTYIARIDCGDYNSPDRLNKQYAFMEQHPEVALCGTWAMVVDEKSKPLYRLTPPTASPQIARKMKSGNCFVHPSVMMRTRTARELGYYPNEFPAAEDYAYFFKFVNQYNTANLPEVLVCKTRESKSISYRRRNTQLMSRLRIIIRHFTFGTESFIGLVKTCMLLVAPTLLVERVKEKFLA